MCVAIRELNKQSRQTKATKNLVQTFREKMGTLSKFFLVNNFFKFSVLKEDVDMKPEMTGFEYDIMSRFEQSQKTSFFKRK
jgi:hypothetical protein